MIRAENMLKSGGWRIRVMGPPPEIRTGCDLVIEFPLVEELNILRLLRKGDLSPLQVMPVDSPLLQPVDLFHVKDFGEYLMVRAANMKLTIEKSTRTIVNISGGGCPDVPYLAKEMVGKSLAEAPSPREIGHTHYAKPTPATQVMELIRYIPKAMEEILKERDRRDA